MPQSAYTLLYMDSGRRVRPIMTDYILLPISSSMLFCYSLHLASYLCPVIDHKARVQTIQLLESLA